MGVFDSAEFEFWGLESKFGRNWSKRFWNFENQICGPKIQNRISSFEVQIFELWRQIFNFASPKLKVEIECQVLGSRFLIVPKPNCLKLSKFQILAAESVSAFSSDFDLIFSIFRVYIRILSSHLAINQYSKYFPIFFSTIIVGQQIKTPMNHLGCKDTT